MPSTSNAGRLRRVALHLVDRLDEVFESHLDCVPKEKDEWYRELAELPCRFRLVEQGPRGVPVAGSVVGAVEETVQGHLRTVAAVAHCCWLFGDVVCLLGRH